MSHDWYWSSEYKGNKGIRRKIVFTVENNKIWRGEWLNAGKRRQQKNYVNYAKEGNERHEEKVFFPWFRHDIHSLLTQFLHHHCDMKEQTKTFIFWELKWIIFA